MFNVIYYFFVICVQCIYSGASIFKFCGEETTRISCRVGCDVVGYDVVMCVA